MKSNENIQTEMDENNQITIAALGFGVGACLGSLPIMALFMVINTQTILAKANRTIQNKRFKAVIKQNPCDVIKGQIKSHLETKKLH